MSQLQPLKHSVRYVSFLALKEILQEHHFSNTVINYYLNRESFSIVDRKLFTNLVYGVTFNDLRLNYELTPFLKIKKTDFNVLLIIKIAIFQMFYLEKIPDYAAINEAIKITKIETPKASKFVTAVLHQARRKGLLAVSQIVDPKKKLAITYSCPNWLINKLNQQLGLRKTKKMLESLIEKPRLSLRVNTTKISRQDLFEQLSQQFPDNFSLSQISPVGIIAKQGELMKTSEFKAGFYTIQDESSQLVAPNLKIKPNDIVLDACAAPGGKTTHIAQYLDAKAGGMVHAFDLSSNKVSLIKENVQRLGLQDLVKVHQQNILNLNQSLPRIKFDKILVDAPCTGFGLLRRKPEVKYNHQRSDIIKTKRLQLNILKAVAPFLKVGGLMLYSTCTIFWEETREVVVEFLRQHSNFTLINLSLNPKEMKKPMLQIYPDDYLTDGFFISLLQKEEA